MISVSLHTAGKGIKIDALSMYRSKQFNGQCYVSLITDGGDVTLHGMTLEQVEAFGSALLTAVQAERDMEQLVDRQGNVVDAEEVKTARKQLRSMAVGDRFIGNEKHDVFAVLRQCPEKKVTIAASVKHGGEWRLFDGAIVSAITG